MTYNLIVFINKCNNLIKIKFESRQGALLVGKRIASHNKNIVSDDHDVSETLNNFFKSAVDSLEIDENKFLLENTDDLINPIDLSRDY